MGVSITNFNFARDLNSSHNNSNDGKSTLSHLAKHAIVATDGAQIFINESKQASLKPRLYTQYP